MVYCSKSTAERRGINCSTELAFWIRRAPAKARSRFMLKSYPKRKPVIKLPPVIKLELKFLKFLRESASFASQVENGSSGGAGDLQVASGWCGKAKTGVFLGGGA